MDALGFALENFDAIGAWRLFDGKHPVDASGELPNGGKFNGPAELASYLRANMQEEFVHCLAEKMLTYALGRGLEFYDQCAVDKIVDELSQNENRFSSDSGQQVHNRIDCLLIRFQSGDDFHKRN